jgi:hypothetical protein
MALSIIGLFAEKKTKFRYNNTNAFSQSYNMGNISTYNYY